MDRENYEITIVLSVLGLLSILLGGWFFSIAPVVLGVLYFFLGKKQMTKRLIVENYIDFYELKAEQEFMDAVNQREKTTAIRLCRELTGCDVHKAISVVDGYMRGDKFEKTKPVVDNRRHSDFVKLNSKNLLSNPEFNAAISSGRNGKAMKICRKLTNCSLKEAKSAITEIVVNYR